MPTFCRHNRLIQNCPICSREQAVEMRPLVSSGPSASPPVSSTSAARAGEPRAGKGSRGGARSPGSGRSAAGLRVRRLDRGAEDGYDNRLLAGLRSSEDARRLAGELAFATGRLEKLSQEPWDLYAEAADPGGDLEERTWLCFQMACLGPLDGEDPWAGVREVRTSWASGEDPAPGPDQIGRRAASPGDRLFAAYRAWAGRSGSQAAGFAGDPSWTPERRFARVSERLSLPGLDRDPRYELLVVLGCLNLYPLSAGSLNLGRQDEVSVAAKRVFGIGDPLLLERRAADLAAACEIPLASMDLALFAWGCGERPDYGLPDETGEEAHLERIARVFGVDADRD